MSREIRFKALSTNGNWYYSDDEAYVLKEYDGVLYLCEDERYYHHSLEKVYVKIGVAIQFTGEQDCKGNDIYGGDELFHKAEGHTGFVEFTNGGFMTDARGWGLDYLGDGEEFEIIVSKHQNPELLQNN